MLDRSSCGLASSIRTRQLKVRANAPPSLSSLPLRLLLLARSSLPRPLLRSISARGGRGRQQQGEVGKCIRLEPACRILGSPAYFVSSAYANQGSCCPLGAYAPAVPLAIGSCCPAATLQNWGEHTQPPCGWLQLATRALAWQG